MNFYIRNGFRYFLNILQRQGVAQVANSYLLALFKVHKGSVPVQGLPPNRRMQDLESRKLGGPTHERQALDAVLLVDYLETVEEPQLILAWAAQRLPSGGYWSLIHPTPSSSHFHNAHSTCFQPYRVHILSSKRWKAGPGSWVPHKGALASPLHGLFMAIFELQLHELRVHFSR